MAVSLKKGQRIDLTKKGQTLAGIHVGLGWDPIKSASPGGFFKKLFSAGSNGDDIDCDASVLLLNEDSKLMSAKDIIYFRNLISVCGSIRHTGDNITGEGEGDDEVIYVDLPKVPDRIHRLVFVVNIYDCKSRGQHFGMIQNAFIRVVDRSSNNELLRYNLTENYSDKTALIAGEIYRKDGQWKFNAIGEGTSDDSIRTLVQKYQ